MTNLVSIIVPAYNVERYLEKCLTSLVSQSYRNIEVIVVNDGSTDSTQKIVDDFSLKYPSIIKSFEKMNGGIADTRNFGLSKVKGEYFTFLDSDDYMENDTIERMLNVALEKGSDIVFSDFWWTFASKEVLGSEGCYEDNREMLVKMFATLWNKLYRTDFIRALNFNFPTGYRYEDASFLYKMVPHVKRWDYVQSPFVHYVQRKGSITHNHNERVKDMIFVFNDLIEYYEKNQLLDSYYKEIEFLFVRFFLGNSFLRSTQIKNRLDRKETLKLSYSLLKQRFPNWKDNTYLKNGGLKNLYFRSINPLTYKIYAIVFTLYYRVKKMDEVE